MEYSYRNAVDGFRVNYTLLVPENNAVLHSSEEQAFLKELDDAYSDIARLTNKSDLLHITAAQIHTNAK